MGETPRGADGSERFRASNRVRVSRDFARVRAGGRRVSSKAFALEIAPSPQGARLGLVVSRRVGGAVVRNRTKRIVREWYRRTARARLPETDLVVIARAPAAELETAGAWRELSSLVARATR